MALTAAPARLVRALRMPILLSAVLLTAACAQGPIGSAQPEADRAYFIQPDLTGQAIKDAKAKRAKGQRVWCVPFARTASGIDLQGNAGTWWKSAAGTYQRGNEPQPGAVIAFASTGKMPMGHVGVVSEVVSQREVLIDHANWSRNKISLKMPVIDVSPKNDWSQVRVKSDGGNLGSVYPLNGFIYPRRQG